ncbi:hypothetical protein TWF128_005233 [Orbilia oligospora]|nr:hypothetical protein TWF128_005233 [Orbilia oligospora]
MRTKIGNWNIVCHGVRDYHSPHAEPEPMAVGAEYEAVGWQAAATVRASWFQKRCNAPSLNYHNADRGSNTIRGLLSRLLA